PATPLSLRCRWPRATLLTSQTLFRSFARDSRAKLFVCDAATADASHDIRRLCPSLGEIVSAHEILTTPAPDTAAGCRGKHRRSRSEAHTSELQSRVDLVSRPLTAKNT